MEDAFRCFTSKSDSKTHPNIAFQKGKKVFLSPCNQIEGERMGEAGKKALMKQNRVVMPVSDI